MRNKIIILLFFVAVVALAQFVLGDACIGSYLEANTLGYYKLEENSALHYLDETPYQRNFTTGDPGTQTAAIIDNGQDMELGNTEYGLTAASEDWEVSQYTVAGWFKPESLAAYQSVFSISNDDGNGYGMIMFIDTDPNYQFYVYPGSATNVYDLRHGSTSLEAGKWYHIAFSYGGDDSLTVYMNGSNDDGAFSDTGGAGAIGFKAGTFTKALLGVRYYNGITSYVDGVMDEWVVFNVSLNSTCIEYLYNSGSPGVEQQYPFASTTPPNITEINCTSPDPDDTEPPFWTNDNTTTFSLTTDKNADCSISKTNGSYWNCTTTGATSHICTLNSTQELAETSPGTNGTVYFNCTDGTNAQTYSYAMYVDTIAPNVTINEPANNTNTHNPTQEINITCSDTTAVVNITFLVNGTVEETNTTPSNNTPWVFNYTFGSYSTFSLSAECWDNVSTYNRGVSENVTIVITTAPVNATAANCTEVINYLEANTMSIFDILFLIQFIALLLLIGYKAYNVVHVGKESIQRVILSFASFFIVLLVGFVVLLIDPGTLFSVLFRLEAWLIVPFVALFIFELFFIIRDRAMQPIQKYDSLKMGGVSNSIGSIRSKL